ncbi:MAG: hypothetical protein CMP59_09065 [Flavobacteriales bacterium]|nr:hypothetical protein [Flavobacteriales bacterium]
MILGLTLFWAFGPKAKKIDLNEISYNTTESSTLYFRNMRAYFYDLNDDEKSGFNIYRIGSREKTESKLHFMIIHNWRLNEAYIMLESDLIDIEKENLSLILVSDTLALEAKDAEANYTFAAKLFEALERGSEVALISGSDEFSFSESELKSIKKSLKDYFKLVGKLR